MENRNYIVFFSYKLVHLTRWTTIFTFIRFECHKSADKTSLRIIFKNIFLLKLFFWPFFFCLFVFDWTQMFLLREKYRSKEKQKALTNRNRSKKRTTLFHPPSFCNHVPIELAFKLTTPTASHLDLCSERSLLFIDSYSW